MRLNLKKERIIITNLPSKLPLNISLVTIVTNVTDIEHCKETQHTFMLPTTAAVYTLKK